MLKNIPPQVHNEARFNALEKRIEELEKQMQVKRGRPPKEAPINGDNHQS
jgi:tetrahydromethanopterin S-methyltransferase subunit G